MKEYNVLSQLGLLPKVDQMALVLSRDNALHKMPEVSFPLGD